MIQVIFHIDMDAFFANAEISQNPDLIGKPVVIAHDSRRSVISTASYEARKYGIHSAMPVYLAKEKCPDLVFIDPHMDLYKHLSNQFFELISHYSNKIEIASIDECYVDMSEYITTNKIQPYALAKQIQDRVYEELKLTCSIGISPNKFLAKMASDMKKPSGITILTHKNIREILWPLKVSKMFGIGKKTAIKLEEIGIQTIGDIANYDNYEKLKLIFGQHSLLFYHRANGKDLSKVESESNAIKSISHSTTFEYDLDNIEAIEEAIKPLALTASERAQRYKMVTNHIGITLKYSRDKSVTRQMVINHFTNSYEDIVSYAKMLLNRHYANKPIRLLGIALNDVKLIEDVKVQMTLFDKNKNLKKGEDIDVFIKEINELENIHLIKASDLLK